MKYLSKFNELLSESNVGWEEIGYTEYKNLFSLILDNTRDAQKITDNEFEKIKSGGPKILNKLLHGSPDYLQFSIKNSVYINILKLPDEWYVVRYYDVCYKCDQFDGLMNLLGQLPQNIYLHA